MVCFLYGPGEPGRYTAYRNRKHDLQFLFTSTEIGLLCCSLIWLQVKPLGNSFGGNAAVWKSNDDFGWPFLAINCDRFRRLRDLSMLDANLSAPPNALRKTIIKVRAWYLGPILANGITSILLIIAAIICIRRWHHKKGATQFSIRFLLEATVVVAFLIILLQHHQSLGRSIDSSYAGWRCYYADWWQSAELAFLPILLSISCAFYLAAHSLVGSVIRLSQRKN